MLKHLETESRGSAYRREGTVAVKKEEAVEGGGQEHDDDVAAGPSVKVETGAAEQGGMLKPEPGIVYKPLSIQVDKSRWQNWVQIQMPVVSR